MRKDGDILRNWQRPITRVIVGAAIGSAITGLIWKWFGPLSLLGGWTAVAAVFTGSTWILLWHSDHVATARHAGTAEPRHRTLVGLILGGALASLGGVGVLLYRHDLAASLIAVGSVVLSWLTIHTLYALIYARHYFGSPHPGGIDFNEPHQHDRPCYVDFFYVAFAVGMSFAISDTNLISTRMRKIALGHALVSFVFGTMIIASVVNLISGAPKS